MTNDQKEVLELAKAHNAIVEPVESVLTIAFYESEFFAFAAALEEKYRAKIAMLNYVLQEVKLDYEFMGVFSQEVLDAISDTQQNTDAFIAEKQAEALEGAAESDLLDDDYEGTEHCRDVLRRMAAELRASAAQPEGKEGGK